MKTRRKVVIGCVVAVLTVAIAIGGYQLGWWLREDSVNRTADIRRDSFERQETLRDQIVAQADDLARVDVQLANPTITADQAAALNGQRAAMSRQLCSLAFDLVGDVTPAISQIIQGEC